ncbi:MAG: hypothetical protein GF307_09620 [candidate division Zixibacteria bacterium]|nr:hypothetical protein [candidate division Zixibacteria bacterium]
MRISKISDAYLNLHIPANRTASKGVQRKGDTVEISDISMNRAQESKSISENPRLESIKEKIDSGYYITDSFQSRLVESLSSSDKFLSDLGLYSK